MPFSTDALGSHEPKPINYEQDGFDGPVPGNVEPFPGKAPLFRVPITEGPGDPRRTHQYTGIIKAALDVLSARLLGLLAMTGAVAMFGHATYDPIPWRTYTAVAYALVVLIPTIYLYVRKG